MRAVETRQGNSPVILGLPHTGTDVPDDIWSRLNDNGKILADTDWHIHKLYDGLIDGATFVRATFHRYCIDANRDPAGVSLYPGQNTTTLIPETDFDGLSIWKDGEAPTEADIADRIARFHRPYHDALAAEIERVKAIHGVAILYDCHSIRSHIPFLFEGKLPDFNIGTDMGKTCDPGIEAAAVEVTAKAKGYTRFSMAASRAAGRRAITAGRKRAFTPSRWSLPNRPILRPKPSPSPMTKPKRTRFACISKPFCSGWKQLPQN